MWSHLGYLNLLFWENNQKKNVKNGGSGKDTSKKGADDGKGKNTATSKENAGKKIIRWLLCLSLE